MTNFKDVNKILKSVLETDIKSSFHVDGIRVDVYDVKVSSSINKNKQSENTSNRRNNVKQDENKIIRKGESSSDNNNEILNAKYNIDLKIGNISISVFLGNRIAENDGKIKNLKIDDRSNSKELPDSNTKNNNNKKEDRNNQHMRNLENNKDTNELNQVDLYNTIIDIIINDIKGELRKILKNGKKVDVDLINRIREVRDSINEGEEPHTLFEKFVATLYMLHDFQTLSDLADIVIKYNSPKAFKYIDIIAKYYSNKEYKKEKFLDYLSLKLNI